MYVGVRASIFAGKDTRIIASLLPIAVLSWCQNVLDFYSLVFFTKCLKFSVFKFQRALRCLLIGFSPTPTLPRIIQPQCLTCRVPFVQIRKLYLDQTLMLFGSSSSIAPAFPFTVAMYCILSTVKAPDDAIVSASHSTHVPCVLRKPAACRVCVCTVHR